MEIEWFKCMVNLNVFEIGNLDGLMGYVAIRNQMV